MSELVVDQLEVIEVDQQQRLYGLRDRARSPVGLAPAFVDEILEMAPVVERGQRIATALIGEFAVLLAEQAQALYGAGLRRINVSLDALTPEKFKQFTRRFLTLSVWAAALPFVINTAGWVLTENGRQPWIVQGLQLTKDGVSPSVTTA